MTTLTGTRLTYPFPAGYTRGELRTEIARYFGWHEITATAGSTGSVIDSSLLRFADDYFAGAQVWIVQADGAAPQFETAWCSAFAASTGTLTLTPALTAAVAAGDRVQVFLRCSKDEIDNAIVQTAYGATAIADLTPSSTSLDYSLNGVSGLLSTAQIVNVWLRSQNRTDVLPATIGGWQAHEDAGILTLRLPCTFNATDGLWVEYTAGEGWLNHDDDRINLPLALLRARALCYLITTHILPKQDGSGMQHWGTLLRDLREELAREERQRNRRPGRARGHIWGHRAGRDAADALGLRQNFGGYFGNYP